MTTENKMGDLISKCWKDEAFKKKFMTDPKSVLKAEGIEIPSGVNVKVVENTEKDLYIMLPSSPHAVMSGNQLEGAAGGAGIVATINPNIFRILVQTKSSTNGSTCYKDCIPW